jgi:predicted nuclease with TOPRIM domain
MVLAALGVGLFGWTVYCSIVFLTYESTMLAKNSAFRQAKASYDDLLSRTAEQRRVFRIYTHRLQQSKQAWLRALGEKSALRSKLHDTDKALGQEQDLYERMLKMRDALTDELEHLQAEAVGLKHRNAGLLASNRRLEEERAAVIAHRAELQEAYDQLRGQLASSHEQNRRLNSAREALVHQLASIEHSLVQVKGEREELVTQRTFLEGRIEHLEQRLDTFKHVQEELVTKLSERSEKMKGILSETGLDIDSLMDEIESISKDDALLSGKGGPFVAYAPELDRRGSVFGSQDDIATVLIDLDSEVQNWAKLQELLRHLPLAAPVDQYAITSPFGKRRDPLNGRYAMHEGLDMRGKWKAPILATAPGTVVFTGWQSKYGRVVEIDHGMGIRTRYAHLRKILVKKGQRVGFRDRIGIMGSSGRTTGRHVHYEVLVHGKPHDPQKFIQAGNHVFKG